MMAPTLATVCLLAAVLSLPALSTSLGAPGTHSRPARAISALHLSLREASAGGNCGAAFGNVVCAAGLCCSGAGVCGTGPPFCSAPDCQLSFGPACDGNQVPFGQDTSIVPRPALGNVPYGVDISRCSVMGKVALTFDDGPYIYTSELLDILKKNNVKATFFVVGDNGSKGQIQADSSGYPAIIRRMHAEGHQVASHTWSHQDLGKITAQQRQEQIIKNEVALVDILGFFPTYFRPPYTSCPGDCYSDLRKFGYHIVNYDVDTVDWKGDYTYSQNAFTSALSKYAPAASSWISLAHDIQPNTVHSLAQYMIDQIRKFGYEPVTVGECLGDPAANWYRNPANGQAWGGKSLAPASTTKTQPSAAQPTETPSSFLSGSTKTNEETIGSAASTEAAPAVTPTPAPEGSNFGAGTGEWASTSELGAPGATTLSHAGSAGRVAPSAWGLLFGLLGLSVLYSTLLSTQQTVSCIIVS
ncbi:uncharacterized protein BCR38DRAFT_75238 [Pseudomassariella vexata]|uniref:NodB homology domain-containing protein n=1 Tax=Pseudomassariella vexata TaxID=1141098 RepID=A0A1Y2DH31_9PEZI|nr:uncharacterized protein BCR38DRAFT_75238 [Pseudomassariella vexata]ORY58035.1 hypothetical protein BCR38DRAFT_75238 [Pseudomassariella vexata]